MDASKCVKKMMILVVIINGIITLCNRQTSRIVCVCTMETGHATSTTTNINNATYMPPTYSVC